VELAGEEGKGFFGQGIGVESGDVVDVVSESLVAV
jgi:hypothetical protein